MRSIVGMILLFCCLLPGCEPRVSAPTSQPLPKDYRIEIDTLASLLPRKLTHLAISPTGTTYYVQEQREGDDVVFSIPAGGIAQATPLTSRAVAEALGKRETVTGNIQSLAVDAKGRVIFFFAGGTRRTNTSCVGVFDPATTAVRILITSDKLAQASLMGGALELARGSVVVSGEKIWLVLQHTAGAAVFRFGAGIAQDGSIEAVNPVFFSIRTPFGKVDLTHDEITYAAGKNGTLLISDRYSGGIWQVDQTGNAELVQNLVGVPSAIATAGLDASGSMATLINDGEPVQGRLEGHVTALELDKALPIFMLKRSDATLMLGRESFAASSSFAVFAASVDQLLPDVTPDHWIGYDTNSGELIRLRLIPVP